MARRDVSLNCIEENIRQQIGDREFERNYPHRLSSSVQRTRYVDELRVIEASWSSAGLPPIYIEDWSNEEEDSESLRSFKYINNLVNSNAVKEILSGCEQLKRIKCKELCRGCEPISGMKKKGGRKSKCCISKLSFVISQDSGRIKWVGEDDAESARECHDYHVECADDCGCLRNCDNRVVQRGRTISLCVFRDSLKGWSLRTTQPIAQQGFVTTYCGQVNVCGSDGDAARYDVEMSVKTSDAETRRLLPHPLVVAARYVGNESRFLNHSCEPNLETYCSIIERYCFGYYTISFWTKREILAGEEMTFDYFPCERAASERTRSMFEDCRCGEVTCRFLNNSDSQHDKADSYGSNCSNGRPREPEESKKSMRKRKRSRMRNREFEDRNESTKGEASNPIEIGSDSEADEGMDERKGVEMVCKSGKKASSRLEIGSGIPKKKRHAFYDDDELRIDEDVRKKCFKRASAPARWMSGRGSLPKKNTYNDDDEVMADEGIRKKASHSIAHQKRRSRFSDDEMMTDEDDKKPTKRESAPSRSTTPRKKRSGLLNDGMMEVLKSTKNSAARGSNERPSRWTTRRSSPREGSGSFGEENMDMDTIMEGAPRATRSTLHERSFDEGDMMLEEERARKPSMRASDGLKSGRILDSQERPYRPTTGRNTLRERSEDVNLLEERPSRPTARSNTQGGRINDDDIKMVRPSRAAPGLNTRGERRDGNMMEASQREGGEERVDREEERRRRELRARIQAKLDKEKAERSEMERAKMRWMAFFKEEEERKKVEKARKKGERTDNGRPYESSMASVGGELGKYEPKYSRQPDGGDLRKDGNESKFSSKAVVGGIRNCDDEPKYSRQTFGGGIIKHPKEDNQNVMKRDGGNKERRRCDVIRRPFEPTKVGDIKPNESLWSRNDYWKGEVPTMEVVAFGRRDGDEWRDENERRRRLKEPFGASATRVSSEKERRRKREEEARMRKKEESDDDCQPSTSRRRSSDSE